MKIAWSMMGMRGGPSMAFLSNSSLICLILVSHFIFLLSLFFFLLFCFCWGSGGGCRFTRQRSFIESLYILFFSFSNDSLSDYIC